MSKNPYPNPNLKEQSLLASRTKKPAMHEPHSEGIILFLSLCLSLHLTLLRSKIRVIFLKPCLCRPNHAPIPALPPSVSHTATSSQCSATGGHTEPVRKYSAWFRSPRIATIARKPGL